MEKRKNNQPLTSWLEYFLVLTHVPMSPSYKKGEGGGKR